MIRKEEIEKAAIQVAGVHPNWSNLDCFRMGFREGAKFADRTMLDRACKWLKDGGYFVNSNESIEDFRKAMEGGAE